MTPAAATPLVSVVIPVFNAERYLGAALASVFAQSYGHLEVLVVDDGSTDGSAEIARASSDPRCRLIPQAHAGAAAARNRGVTASRGALLSFLDADDVWMPGKTARQVDVLTRDAAVDMVFGHYVTLDADGVAAPQTPAPGMSMGTMTIRRERCVEVGPFCTEWRVGEFIEWYARAEDAGLRRVMLPDVMLGRREHDANLTGASRDARVDYARILRQVAQRRGRPGRRL